MDAVITYVNGLDPEWQKDYIATVGMETFMDKRFRDWGTLKYLLRGIEIHLPFIKNVYLIVSGDSQVPEWVNRSKVNIVLHKDIIPAKHLPVFNSTAIEMYMHRIPGLSEEFVYFNDDFFPVMDCSEEDFFKNGKAVMKLSPMYMAYSLYDKHVKNSDRLARRASGTAHFVTYLRPQHICSPLLKSKCEELWAREAAALNASISKLRTRDNFNYYAFCDYAYFTGSVIQKRLSKKHLSLAVSSPDKLRDNIINPRAKILCINDVNMSQDKYEAVRASLLDSFSHKFPAKSAFEL